MKINENTIKEASAIGEGSKTIPPDQTKRHVIKNKGIDAMNPNTLATLAKVVLFTNPDRWFM